MMDDKTQFSNAKLQLSDGDTGYKPASSATSNHTTKTGPATTIRTARIPGKSITEYAVNSMFSYKDGAFKNAVELTKREIIRSEIDGELQSSWLLTEIDHWDIEKERIVILCDHTLLIVRFDFIAMCLKDYKRLALHVIDKLQVGDLVYPSKSLMPARKHGGVRLIWNKTEDLSLGQKWNPFASDIPYTTFAHHPLIYYEPEKDNPTYNVDHFCDMLIHSLNHVYQTKRAGESLLVEQGNILIESYASLTSMVFNQSNLGFSRERGGVSF